MASLCDVQSPRSQVQKGDLHCLVTVMLLIHNTLTIDSYGTLSKCNNRGCHRGGGGEEGKGVLSSSPFYNKYLFHLFKIFEGYGLLWFSDLCSRTLYVSSIDMNDSCGNHWCEQYPHEISTDLNFCTGKSPDFTYNFSLVKLYNRLQWGYHGNTGKSVMTTALD